MIDSQLALTIVAVALAGTGTSLITFLLNKSQNRRDRHREHFSKALQAVTKYEEFPYVIRRRRASDPESERIRISTELREVQAELTYHSTWLRTESRIVGAAYEILVKNLRRVAGGAMHDAWTLPTMSQDSGMNISDIGPKLAELEPFKEQYVLEVRHHLSLWPRWLCRLVRRSA